MELTLTPELERLVREKVDSGLYSDASDVVREALRLLIVRDQVKRERLERLRDAVDIGVRSGPPEPLDVELLIAELDAEDGAHP